MNKTSSVPRVGLALAGGGPLGAIYEIGALAALQDALPGLRLHALDGYVGVSAGAIVAAALANGITPRQLVAAFIDRPRSGRQHELPRSGRQQELPHSGRQHGRPHNAADAAADRIDPAIFFHPAWGEFARRLGRLPWLAFEAAWRYAVQRRSALASLEALGSALPSGLFSSDALERRLREVLSRDGRSNDFRSLSTRLVLVATDLDSGAAMPFGSPGRDAVPISVAAAASAALPGLFPPVEIDGRAYVDGALKKTLHASVLLDSQVELLFCFNPLVPFEAGRGDGARLATGSAHEPIPSLVEGGLPLVLSQTFRSLIHSRLELGMKGYESSHPDTDIVLFEPDHHDPQLFLANIFSVSQRARLAEHAYQSTRRRLRSQRSRFAALFTRHGLRLDDDALDDPSRVLVAAPLRASQHALRRLEDVLADLEQVLARAYPAAATASPR
jgi:predicted acylesterase/phospholipase RssA